MAKFQTTLQPVRLTEDPPGPTFGDLQGTFGEQEGSFGTWGTEPGQIYYNTTSRKLRLLLLIGWTDADTVL